MDKNLSVAAFCKPATGKKLVCASGFRFCCFYIRQPASQIMLYHTYRGIMTRALQQA